MRACILAIPAALAVCLGLPAQDRSSTRITIPDESWKNIGPYDPERHGPPPGLLPVRPKDGPAFWADQERGCVVVSHGEDFSESRPLNLPVRSVTSIALTANGRTLLVSSRTDWSVWAFPLGPDGMPTKGQRAFNLRLPPAVERLAVGALQTDTAGRVYAATAQGIQVFDARGRVIEVLAVPARGNICGLVWDGAKRNVLIAHGDWKGGSLFALRLNATGTEQ